ncbi:Gfo/Idh/MocA family oxidoreductase [Sphingomonas sp. CGMCC 1.13654]|uniref:Gfo/Idh/MocA family oxidoreductase n=1 Tax=Sphingomonas chungangi TaxID=2683589 RepID=A0A838L9W4_9SPHN|nr:Gfo/Idh/MocA family oxidoreductase [Sphingomonas chungangi]MBA2935964.1 Gfo/Idh/MocA family oxidoreductase [Sphingomonas chungangi]MVW55354.1 gfo/Idh/MocA family oxidoreductase [Sphingomonas chungangi]
MTVKVAVVGLGKMGLSHLAMVNALDDFEVVAICDSAAMVGSVIEKYGKLRYVADYDQLLKLPELEAVVIATPTTTHEPMARKALERGLHIFCEKPLTLSAQQSRELAELAASKGLIAQVGYHNRFIGTFSEVKKLLDAGALGRITHVQGEAYGPVVLKPAKPTWRGKAGNGGGCLYDYAAHPLNLLNWYFGRPLACSGAVLKSGFSAEVDDEVYATLGFEGGVTGQLSVNWSDPSVRKMTTRVSVWGEGGKLYADRQEIQVFLTGSAPIPEGYRQGWTVNYITHLTPPVSFYLRGEEYTAQLEAFARAIIEKRTTYGNSFAGAADTDAAIEMIRSAAAGSTGVIELAAPQQRKAGGLVGRMFGR